MFTFISWWPIYWLSTGMYCKLRMSAKQGMYKSKMCWSLFTWDLWTKRNVSRLFTRTNVQLSRVHDWKCICCVQANGSYVTFLWNCLDMFIHCFFALLAIIEQRPCHPSPCGPNSQCREINGQAVCSCVSTYIGSPPSCRPECVVNSECLLSEACVNQKCADPCPGSCGQSGESLGLCKKNMTLKGFVDVLAIIEIHNSYVFYSV